MLDQRFHGAVDMQYAIGNQSQDGVRTGHTPDFLVEARQVQPVGGLGDRHQVSAGRRQPAVLGQGHAILDPLASLRLVDLRGAGVGTDHPFETLGQQHRELSGAAAAVQGQAGAGAERGQLVDQPRRVGRTMCGVVRRTRGEMILERCRHGTLPK